MKVSNKTKGVGVKHFIRDILVFLISITGVSFLYRKKEFKKGPLVRVIAFHHIRDKEWFEKTIKFLTEEYHVITPTEFHNKEFHPEKINILITFDDGYTSWINKALPVLEQYKVKAVFFIISGLLDVAKDREARRAFFRDRLLLTPKSALTWSGAERLMLAGHTIGGHTVTHANLAKLNKEGLREEIQGDKRYSETHLSTTFTDFAYPFGRKQHYTKEAQEIAEESGYQFIYTAETGFYKGDNLEIPRTLIERGQRKSSVRRWIDGGYDIFTSLHV